MSSSYRSVADTTTKMTMMPWLRWSSQKMVYVLESRGNRSLEARLLRKFLAILAPLMFEMSGSWVCRAVVADNKLSSPRFVSLFWPLPEDWNLPWTSCREFRKRPVFLSDLSLNRIIFIFHLLESATAVCGRVEGWAVNSIGRPGIFHQIGGKVPQVRVGPAHTARTEIAEKLKDFKVPFQVEICLVDSVSKQFISFYIIVAIALYNTAPYFAVAPCILYVIHANAGFNYRSANYL